MQQREQSVGRRAQTPQDLQNERHANLREIDQFLQRGHINVENDLNPDLVGFGFFRGSRQLHGMETQWLRPRILQDKKGTTGRPIRLHANYFPIMRNTDWTFYRYNVDFEPEEDLIELKKELFAIATEGILLGYLFDGSTVYTIRRLVHNTVLFVVNFPENSGDEPTRITLRYAGNVTLENELYMPLFNTIMIKCFRSVNEQLVGRNLFDSFDKIQVDGKENEMFPDYIASIYQHENTVMLCCEISQNFLRKGNVLNALIDIRQRTGERDFKAHFTNLIIDNIVLTCYNNCMYQIDDVDWTMTPRAMFCRADGRIISYVEYYKERYNLCIKNINQPMLISRIDPRELRVGMPDILYLVPELCRMTGLTDQDRSNAEMRQLTEYMHLSPRKYAERLNVFRSRLRSNTKVVEELNRWDLILADKPVEVMGRVLSPEFIIQGENGRQIYSSGNKGDWTQNLHSNRMLLPAKLKVWTIIIPKAMTTDALNFMQLLRRVAYDISFYLPEPHCELVFGEQPLAYIEAIDRAMRQDPQLLLVFVPDNTLDRYRAIKKKTLVDNPILSQIVLHKSIMSKDVVSIATKLLIQINCKLGGAPWTIDMPLSSLMVVGIDVCQDTLYKGRFFCALVASLNKHCTSYFSTVSEHFNDEQYSANLIMNLTRALEQWRTLHEGNLPSRIIIYRDGLGDNQQPTTKKQEAKLIRDHLATHYEGNTLMFAYIVVKRYNKTRIFDGVQNPPPGTVVDDVITLPQCYDFYLVSQYVEQGVVSPTYYSVLYDTLGLNPDKIQRLTYKLTHLYFNWSGTVSVPACCQYARKLASLIGRYIHQIPSRALENILYYL